MIYNSRTAILIVANTSGEFEAGLSAASSMKLKPVFFLGNSPNFKKFVLSNIDFYENITGLKISYHFMRFYLSWFYLFFNKLTGSKVLISINSFDKRHKIIVRILYRIIATGMIRDSLIPHQKPIKYETYNFLPPLVCERNMDCKAYKNFKILSVNKSKFFCNLQNYLLNDVNIKKSNKIVFITKNVAPKDRIIQKKYYEVFFSNIKSLSKIVFKIHPRDNYSQEFCFERGINITNKNIFELASNNNILIIFGGSSGWLEEYHRNIIYITDKTFNRSCKNYRGRIQVRSLKDIYDINFDNLLLK